MSDLIKHSGPQSVEKVIYNLKKNNPSHYFICEAIKKYNHLRKVPLSAIDVLEWKDILVELWPDLDPESVNFVVNKMIAQEIECDGGGIQNIVKGLKRLDVDAEGKYFVKSDHTY